MSFLSLEFLVLFVVVLFTYFSIPHRFRWILLFASSYLYYGYYNFNFLYLLLFSNLIDYFAGRAIAATPKDTPARRRRRRLYLTASLIGNFGLLGIFKYFNFFNASIASVFGVVGVPYGIGSLELLLPAGISFYTFQSVAYIIDVYRGDVKAERHFGVFMTFIAFFPQLVAGPVERAKDLLPQFYTRHRFNMAQAVEGLQLILWGVFKKMVIADRLAIYVNTVYAQPSRFQGLPLIIAVFFFGFQIYCDFSAYSDIAVGTARILGFKLAENFRQPELSTSIREFWTRWHITLGTWFRDYVYIPLARMMRKSVYPRFNIDRRSLFATIFPSVVVFFLIGLWHGASWTFVIWGLLQIVFVTLETISDKRRKGRPERLPKLARGLLAFTLVSLAGVFFRAATVGQALFIYANMADFSTGTRRMLLPYESGLFAAPVELILSFTLILLLLVVDTFISRNGGEFTIVLRKLPRPQRWVVYYGLASAIVVALFYSGLTQSFIYFAF